MSPSLSIEVVLPPDVPERERILGIVLRWLDDTKNPWSLVEEASSDPAVLRLWLLGGVEKPPVPENTILIGQSGTAWDWVSLAELDQRLPRLLPNLLEVLFLREQARTDATTVEVLNEIGRALSAETDRDRLLDELLTRARRLVRADGGSIYLIHQQQLIFVAAQNDTVNFFRTRRCRRIARFDAYDLVAFHYHGDRRLQLGVLHGEQLAAMEIGGLGGQAGGDTV